ncbi:hybrid sensor histidine kinase/response regulator, partial [Synechococcus sp. H55.10]
LGFGSSDFEATPLSLEAEASSAFDELFANAEALSDIEETPPELIPPSPEPFSQVFEELSPEEGRGDSDLAELFGEVVDEAAAELASVEPTELRGAEETSQAVWDVPLAAQVAAASLEEAPAADEAASAGVEALFELEELAVESSPLQELSQLPDLGAAPDSGPEADLWAEELSSSLQPIPG